MSNNTAAVSAQVSAQLDLSVSQRVEGTVARGAEVTWVTTVTNAGPSPAAGVTATVVLPVGLETVADAASGTGSGGGGRWSCDLVAERTVVCHLAGLLNPGGSVALAVRTVVAVNAPEGPMSVRTVVAAPGTELVSADNAVEVSALLGPLGGSSPSAPIGAPSVASTHPEGVTSLAYTGPGSAQLISAGLSLVVMGAMLTLGGSWRGRSRRRPPHLR